MEAADIDWRTVESTFVPDDKFEHFNAPKWLDLSAPDSLPADPDAWFCRPDCRHPKTHQDFLTSPKLKTVRSTSARFLSPLGDGDRKPNNSLKRRGAILGLLPTTASSPVREAIKNKSRKFREDSENVDPNVLVEGDGVGSASKGVKVEKEGVVKSSVEKRGGGGEERGVPKLRSTLSARNLFSGRDILGQISEFCNEIKKLAVGKEKSSDVSCLVKEEEEAKMVLNKSNSTTTASNLSAKKKRERLMVDVEKCNKGGGVLREVRAHPPTPQKFPSPLNKPFKSNAAHERGILQDLGQGKEEKKKTLASKENDENRAASAAAVDSEGNSVDMFWFFKPCTYLVK